MTRDQLKALIVEVLATTQSACGLFTKAEWESHSWSRHRVEKGDRGHHGYVQACALCRGDIPALADAITVAVDIRCENELRTLVIDGGTAEKSREMVRQLREALREIDPPND